MLVVWTSVGAKEDTSSCWTPGINKNDFFFLLAVAFPSGFKVSQGDLYYLKIYFMRIAIGLHGRTSRGCVYEGRIYLSIYIFTTR